MTRLNRRQVTLSLVSGLTFAGVAGAARAAHPRIVVLGGGPAGATAALALKGSDPRADVVLVERDPTRLGRASQPLGPFQRPGSGLDLDTLTRAGVSVVLDEIVDIDWSAARLEAFSGRRLAYDRLVLAPGTAPLPEDIPGLDARARHMWPAAWGNAREARRLATQLATFPENGQLVLRLPEHVSHPAVAVDRISALARLVGQKGPDARMTVLDASATPTLHDAARVQLGGAAFQRHVTWHQSGMGGQVLSVDAAKGLIDTDAGQVRADLVNFVVPHGAGPIARQVGLTDTSGWCPVHADGRSVYRDQVTILGDARRNAVRTVNGAIVGL